MKKLLSMFILGSSLCLCTLSAVSANNDDGESNAYKAGQGGFRGQWTKSNPDTPGSSQFEENVSSEDGSNTLLETVRTAINRLLGLLAFIALLFLLYGGFKVLTAGTDEAALGEAWKIVKNAGLGILMIAVSWIIVTFIFFLAGILTETNDEGLSSEPEGTKDFNADK